MQKKTCFVKEDSIELFKNNLIDPKINGESDLNRRIRELSESLSSEKNGVYLPNLSIRNIYYPTMKKLFLR